VHDSSSSYVLVVDDDSDLRELMADLLRGRGYAVEEASDGSAALAAMRSATPAVVLLDLVLPGCIDGWGVLHEMKTDPALSAIPVCVCSASPVRLPAGTTILKKPVPFSELYRVVESHCGGSRPQPS